MHAMDNLSVADMDDEDLDYVDYDGDAVMS